MWTFLVLVASVAAAALFVLSLTVPLRYRPSKTPADGPVQIVVLGDIGRSPRMQYHALSVARRGGRVDIIAYKETARHPELIKNPRVHIYPLAPPPAIITEQPFFLAGPLKALWQVCTLTWRLTFSTPPARWIIVQNPPSIPTLSVCMVISILRNSQLLIDWHNYGWSILATTKGYSHPFVGFYRLYERFFGRIAPTANLTVTDAMSRQLKAPPYNFRRPIYTLHDRPALIFQPVASQLARGDFLMRLPAINPFAKRILAGTTRLVVSSTSWTPDEDFDLLLDALVQYSGHHATKSSNPDTVPPPLLVVITGKGPQRAMYEYQIKQLNGSGKLGGVEILTAWLSAQDYASLLSCADLGVCLHRSSSGVDLPMKVVDMFGAGLPVVAYGAYESFDELVKVGVNGQAFATASELASIFLALLSSAGQHSLEELRRGAVREGAVRWDQEWDRVVGPMLGFGKNT